MQNDRKKGFYWILHEEYVQVAEWNQFFEVWYLTGVIRPFKESEIHAIDEMQIKRKIKKFKIYGKE